MPHSRRQLLAKAAIAASRLSFQLDLAFDLVRQADAAEGNRARGREFLVALELALRIASPSPTAVCSISTRPMSVSAGKTIARTAVIGARSCVSTSPSSCAASCSTSSQPASIASVTHRADKLELCRRALNVPSPRTAHANSDNTGATSSDHEPPPCPCCGGRMIVIETFDGPLSPAYHVRKLDGL